jgi:hypothetical protein
LKEADRILGSKRFRRSEFEKVKREIIGEAEQMFMKMSYG